MAVMNENDGNGVADAIPVRDIRFDLSSSPLCWHGGRAGVTAFFDAMSACFPLGEKFFIKSVKRAPTSNDDPVQSAAVRGFIGQESIHSREHAAYNKRLVDAGYDIAFMESKQSATIAWIENRLGVDAAVGITACMEHLTSILAEQITGDEAYLEGADEAMRDLWLWHCMEEAEHGAVAFDVLMKLKRGYFFRVGVMLLSTWMFLEIITRNFRTIARKSLEPSAVREALSYLLFSPGLARRSFIPYFRWYLPGFHPTKGPARARAARYKAQFDLRASGAAEGV